MYTADATYGAIPGVSSTTPTAAQTAAPKAGGGDASDAVAPAASVRAPLLDRSSILLLVGMVGVAIVLTQVEVDAKLGVST